MTVETGGPQERLHSRDAYLAPTRECDVVMKGGITSGVLYPLAVCELASVYRLRNVGGTSAGAIAAAAAAAAEYGRTSEKPGSGFQGLAALPAWLGTDDHLVGLFRPPAVTRRLHGLLLRAVSPGASRVRLLGAVVWSGLRSGRWWLPVLGAAAGRPAGRRAAGRRLRVVAVVGRRAGRRGAGRRRTRRGRRARGGAQRRRRPRRQHVRHRVRVGRRGRRGLALGLAGRPDRHAGRTRAGWPAAHLRGPVGRPGARARRRRRAGRQPRDAVDQHHRGPALPAAGRPRPRPRLQRGGVRDGSSRRGWSRTWCSTRQARAPTRGWCRGRRPATCRWSWRPG